MWVSDILALEIHVSQEVKQYKDFLLTHFWILPRLITVLLQKQNSYRNCHIFLINMKSCTVYGLQNGNLDTLPTIQTWIIDGYIMDLVSMIEHIHQLGSIEDVDMDEIV